MKRFLSLTLATTLAIFTLPCQAQSLSQLDWLRGSWTQEKDGSVVQESWLAAPDVMVGVNLSRTVNASSFEFLRVVEHQGQITYLASPSGQAPTAFKLKELKGQRVVFENLAHDFPQRILYWKESDGSLRARVEGRINGKLRAMDWHFSAAKP